MSRALVITFIIFLTVPAYVFSQPYFPDQVFDTDPKNNDFTVQYYTKHLIALEEPSLLALSENKHAHCYRFLWLRTFDRPIALRLTVDPEGTGLLTFKMTDGAGGYEPGKLRVNEAVHVSQSDVAKFISMLKQFSFWQQSTIESTDVIGLDGANWVMEGVKDGRYHILDRWSPEKGLYREASLFLLNLSRIKVKEIY